MNSSRLNAELCYLAQLTASGLKPLSRWEGSASQTVYENLRRQNLQCRTVQRTTCSGKSVTELVFSRERRLLDVYARRFDGRSLDRTDDDRRIEGWLFGYPSCCVESYLRHGYRPNGLASSDQKTLFHWACPQCTVTPVLLPHYRRAYHASRAHSPSLTAPHPSAFRLQPVLRQRVRESLAMAASLMALGAADTFSLASPPPDPHQVPLSAQHDTDRDGLTDQEELDLKTDPAQPDANANRVPDGADLALASAGQIGNLPSKPTADRPYRLDFLLRGLEQCAVCGINVNMGHLTVCNPRSDLYAPVPYIALHCLEHGSFSHAGDVHGSGRLDPSLLRATLDATTPSHFSPATAEDADNDGLIDAEEQHFRTDPNRADTNLDGVPDGFSVARGLWDSIVRLTRATDAPVHATDHLMRGLVTCPICGAQENMGYVEIVNTHELLSVKIPYLALHFLRHGSFGTGADGRLNPRLIDLALRGDGTSHLVVVPGDADQDGVMDPEEKALGTDPDRPDTNGDGMLDGIAAARSAFQRIRDLPHEPKPDQAYALLSEADCYVPCTVCGVDVNCGHVELVQPWTDMRMVVTYRLLHFLEHGSFASSLEERVSPLQLEAFLAPSVLILGEGEPSTLRWYGNLGRRYQVQSADRLNGPWESGPILTGADAPLTYSEPGAHSASRRFYRLLVW